LRQCQKFVEIVGALVEKAEKSRSRHNNDSLSSISVMDLGCGRAYLSFSLHSYLHEKYSNAVVTTLGIDVRPKLIAEISGIANSLGDSFRSLQFEEGTIEKIVEQSRLSGGRMKKDFDGSLDILVALHACDTATDDALYSGIARGADVIVVAPCCHKQLRPQLDAYSSSKDPILRHGIYRERMTETVTDSLRALLLELAGYKVQVFEFIGGEHTSKNTMITAIKSRHTVDNKEVIQEHIKSLATNYGIRDQKLAQWTKVSLTEGGEEGKPAAAKNLTKHRMPPFSRPEEYQP
jgi:hypothetical protein